MRVLHVVPGLDVVGNGIAVAAKLLAAEQGADLVEARFFAVGEGGLDDFDEVWVHSCWLPMTLKSCWRVLMAGKPLVRMTHANLDPVRLRYHGWKKWLVGPIERWCLRRCAKIVATCEAEAEWIRAYEPRVKSIEVTDIKRFFNLNPVNPVNPVKKDLHLLYLGRRHPLKGLSYLESAVRQIWENRSDLFSQKGNPSPSPSTVCCELRVVSSAFGEELEKVWDWCDVLVLPTLSENFGLVVAEALERGKCVITTDGAPAWECECKVEKCKVGDAGSIWQGYDGRLIYLKGYRDGTPDLRLNLLSSAITLILRKQV